MHYGECEVKFFQGAKINDRVCTCLQVVPSRRRGGTSSSTWPGSSSTTTSMCPSATRRTSGRTARCRPEVMEEYTYLNLKLNNGFSDEDFDLHNPKYHFYR